MGCDALQGKLHWRGSGVQGEVGMMVGTVGCGVSGLQLREDLEMVSEGGGDFGGGGGLVLSKGLIAQ